MKPTHGAANHSDQHKEQADDKPNDKRDDKQGHTEETSNMTSWMTRKLAGIVSLTLVLTIWLTLWMTRKLAGIVSLNSLISVEAMPIQATGIFKRVKDEVPTNKLIAASFLGYFGQRLLEG